MLFQSQEFTLLLLPVTLALFYAFAGSRDARDAIIGVSSLIFYGWWDPRFVPLFLAHVLATWAGAKATAATGRKLWADLAVAAQFASLAFFKYTDFLLQNLAAAMGATLPPSGIILPIGISFFTFQLVSYLIDVRRGESPAHSLREVYLFIAFFPQLIAGPIVRHNELVHQFALDPRRPGVAERLGKGFCLFVLGLAKKVLLADQLAATIDPLFAPGAAAPSFGQAWVGSLGFTLQVFLDFAAYSEMAIGLGYMFGFTIPENFAAPLRATDLQELWRRWHITLTRFLRDYLYRPLGGNRAGPGRFVFATMVTMTACGLWHGAGWNFLLWGVLHGVGLLVVAAWKTVDRPIPMLPAWFLTMFFFVAVNTVFRAPDLATAWTFIVTTTGVHGFGGPFAGMGIVAISGLVSIVLPASHRLAERWIKPYPALAVAAAAAFVYLVVYVGRGAPQSFVYFQF
jgi:D-alanyl-lipoteichoic acid acyltransferase DltB (MBOAT superfamily)